VDLQADIRATVRVCISGAIGAVLARKSLDHTHAAFLAMFGGTLHALCSVATFDEDIHARAHARLVIPSVAASLLLRELRLSGELQGRDELAWLTRAVEVFHARRRYAPGSVAMLRATPGLIAITLAVAEGTPAPPPPSDFEVRLSCAFDQVAARELFRWAAHPPENGIDLATLELVVGERRTVDRVREFKEVQARAKAAGRSVTVRLLCKRAKVGYTQFFSHWYGNLWADSSAQAESIHAQFARPVTDWPLS
jgi:hypothetical protein